ncbi:proton-conducting transporter membrane subunit [Microcella alkalica]|uniref:proton-conducting transporter transmembrane domain-containing protein n=1 Tax=Microcella alkalica TaxID=355930 RepID=UPI00145F4878|nr:proton-conducting transporter membrane subunit [Microcella alkalica]
MPPAPPISLEPLSVLLLVLVAGIALAVLPYAHRSLRGDRRGRSTTVAIAAMLVSTAVLAVADAPWLIAAAWSAATLATLAALGLGGGAAAVRRAAPWLVIGDLALWGAVAAIAAGGRGDLAAVLLVVAAGIRCAAPPAHGWLVDSLHAPTPVSAALHGGIVNGGGILLLSQLPVLQASPLALGLLAALAAVAVVAGTIGALVRTDVKGRLVLSTVAQMGFMLLCLALGLAAAAALHLVAHGFYKSALFLGSSDGIDRRAADRRAPAALRLTAAGRRVRMLVGALPAVLALVVTALALYPGGRGLPEALLLLVMAAAVATAGYRAALAARTLPHALGVGALAAAGATAFAALTSALSGALALPSGGAAAGGAAVPLVLAVLTIAALAGLAAVRGTAPSGRLGLRILALGHRLGGPGLVGRPRSRPAASRTAGSRFPIGASA